MEGVFFRIGWDRKRFIFRGVGRGVKIVFIESLFDSGVRERGLGVVGGFWFGLWEFWFWFWFSISLLRILDLVFFFGF